MPGVIALVQDLMFASRIREAATALGVAWRPLRRSGELAEACRADRPTLVVADLDDDRLNALAGVASLRSDPALADIRVVGFLSHVQGERATAARDAGCTRVLARSAFVRELPELLRTPPPAATG